MPGIQNWPILNPDGSRVLLTDTSGKVVMWDTGTGKQLYEVAGPPGPWGPRCFSADGKWLALASGSPYTERGRIDLRDARTGKLLKHWLGNQGDIACLAFSEDGKYLASGSSDTSVLIWDVTGKGRDGPAAPPGRKALDQLWTDLASEDADRAAVAVERLSNSPAVALRLLRDRFKPVVQPNPAMVARWIAEIDDGRFAVHERATRELRSRIKILAPALRQMLAGPLSPEARRRVEDLLDWTAHWTPEQLRAARATQVLEAIGDADAKAILRAVAGGAPQAQPTLEAKAALQRLNRDDR
ncbi:MAG TPA: hypothetical protein VFA18_20820 [Gemmataceae bacterium]|nr:hypothetical protein [Gemmataceae bacterium]